MAFRVIGFKKDFFLNRAYFELGVLALPRMTSFVDVTKCWIFLGAQSQ